MSCSNCTPRRPCGPCAVKCPKGATGANGATGDNGATGAPGAPGGGPLGLTEIDTDVGSGNDVIVNPLLVPSLAQRGRAALRFTGSSTGTGTVTLPLPSIDSADYTIVLENRSDTDLTIATVGGTGNTVTLDHFIPTSSEIDLATYITDVIGSVPVQNYRMTVLVTPTGVWALPGFSLFSGG
jgi:hypothetical protein